MEERIDKNVYCKTIGLALRVGFLTNSHKLKLYAGALYSAMMWGVKV